MSENKVIFHENTTNLPLFVDCAICGSKHQVLDFYPNGENGVKFIFECNNTPYEIEIEIKFMS